MWPPGRPSSRSRSTGVITSRHGRPLASRASTLPSGSASTSCSDRSAARRARVRARSGSERNRSTGVCRPNRVSVWYPAARSSLAEDRRVGERVAVDLAGQRIGHPPGCGLGVRLLKPRVALPEVQRPGEGHLGVQAGAQPRQPADHHVDLDLATHRRGRSRLAAQQPVQSRRGAVREHEIGGQALAAGQVDLRGPAVARRDARDPGARAQRPPRPRWRPGPARRPPHPFRRPGPATRRCRCRSRGRGSTGSAAATGRGRS